MVHMTFTFMRTTFEIFHTMYVTTWIISFATRHVTAFNKLTIRLEVLQFYGSANNSTLGTEMRVFQTAKEENVLKKSSEPSLHCCSPKLLTTTAICTYLVGLLIFQNLATNTSYFISITVERQFPIALQTIARPQGMPHHVAHVHLNVQPGHIQTKQNHTPPWWW